ncbi:MAG: helix-turn-helix domain-containing protein [Eubacterium sp.]|nr:helix-turn-helix domain-containing protein [Eubacterium sp.]
MLIDSNDKKNRTCEAIKKFRLMKRMSARELASRTGIAASNLSAIEKGERVPKLDMCNKIAKALEVDPVELCDLELTEVDEKRLLMKLLTKYADIIEIAKVEDENGNQIYDPKGKSIVTLPIDFADFALRYAKHIDNIKFAVEGVDKADPRYELIKENAEDEFNYWLNMYPTYDAVNTAQKNAMENNKQQSDDKKDKEMFTKAVDIDMVNTWSSVIQEEMNPYFWMYQSNYIIPNRNKAWRAKNTL